MSMMIFEFFLMCHKYFGFTSLEKVKSEWMDIYKLLLILTIRQVKLRELPKQKPKSMRLVSHAPLLKTKVDKVALNRFSLELRHE